MIYDSTTGVSHSIGFPMELNAPVSTAQPLAINDFGVVVGYRGLVNEGAPHHIGILYDGEWNIFSYSESRIFDINNAGEMIASGRDEDYVDFYYKDGMWNFAPEKRMFSAINDHGVIVGTGTSDFGETTIAPFFFQDGTITPLPLPPVVGSAMSIEDLNNNGHFIASIAGTTVSFLFKDGEYHELPGFSPSAINDGGTIVGVRESRAVVYDGITVKDLNTLIPSTPGVILNYTTAINNRGQIVANGTLDGRPWAFLLTPEATDIPEPGTLVMTLGALAGIAALLGRNRR